MLQLKSAWRNPFILDPDLLCIASVRTGRPCHPFLRHALRYENLRFVAQKVLTSWKWVSKVATIPDVPLPESLCFTRKYCGKTMYSVLPVSQMTD